jgi:hypothetical protein
MWIFSSRSVKYLRGNGSSISPFIRRSQKDLERYTLFSFFTLRGLSSRCGFFAAEM